MQRDRTAGRRRPAQDHGRARLPARWPTRPTRHPTLLEFPPTAIEGLGRPHRGGRPAVDAATARCRRCRAVTAGCSSSWSGTTPASCASRAAALLAASGCLDGERGRPTRLRLWPCGRSARTVPDWPASACPTRRTRAGRTPPSRRSSSGTTCGTSTPCSPIRAAGPAVRALRRRLRARPDRLPADLGGWRRAVYREFVEDAARLVAGYGGSMSGEHGDGRARSALLPAMYSPAALDLFAQVKAAFDPDNQLNPGVLVDPRPVDADLRAAALVGRPARSASRPRCTAAPGSASAWPTTPAASE